MSTRASTAAAILVPGLLVTACATPVPDAVDARAEPVYRTGSNIPLKDGSPSRVISVKPDDAPRAPGMPLPPRSGG